MRMKGKTVMYVAIGVGVLSAVSSLFVMKAYLIIFSSIVAASMLLLYGLWDVFEAAVVSRSGVVQMIGDFELEGGRLSATRKTPGGFSATAAAQLSASPSKELNRDNIERIVANSNAPFRFVVQAERLSASKILDGLKTRRRMKEIELSKARAKEHDGHSRDKVIEREIELLEGEIRAIANGASPIKVDIYIMTTATAESRFLAEERAQGQIKELSGEFSAVIGAGFEQVSGSGLVRLLKIDSVANP
jgi:hypothetical protein